MMKVDIQQLGNEAAVEALSLVAQAWMVHRGLEVYKTYHGVRSKAAESYEGLPSWARDAPVATDESADFARRMLTVLSDSSDDEVQLWTQEALEKVQKAQVHAIDPLTLSIGGVILIGAILAARVKKIGSVEFYKGIPENLAKVIKAGASLLGG